MPNRRQLIQGGSIVAFGAAMFIGGILFDWNVPQPRMLFHDRGHAVSLVADEQVAKLVIGIAQKNAGLRPIMEIASGGTHQTVLSDGVTVIMYVDKDVPATNARMLIVDDAQARMATATDLVQGLKRLGHPDAKVIQPDASLPRGTMLLVTSPTALPGGGFGFRPGLLTMKKLSPNAARFD